MSFGGRRVKMVKKPANRAPTSEETAQDELANALHELETAIAVPADAFKAFREQYNSTALLERLRTFHPTESGFTAILAIIDRDLFVPQLNFVFGEADARMQTAIISLARLRPEFYGLPQDDQLLKSRVIKEAIHEMGHIYGLTHCPDPACVMFFSNSLEDTDSKGPDFCQLHRDPLGEILARLKKTPRVEYRDES
jgi:archaemetzincin